MPNEAEVLKSGDDKFIGVNMRLAPENLTEGIVSYAKNLRFDNGIATPRRGFKKVGWANQANTKKTGTCSIAQHTNQTACENASGTWTADAGGGQNIGTKPFENIKGVGKFKDPAGVNWLMVATSEGNAGQHKVYALTPGNDIQTINTNLTFDSYGVRFVQCFNVVVMFRGPDLEPLKLSRVEDGFGSITQEDTDTTIEENEDEVIVNDGTDKIPNSEGGAIFFQNRLLIPYAVVEGGSVDYVAVSMALNYTRYKPLMSSLRINQGEESELVALHKFDQTTLLCFKESSIYAVRNLTGSLSDLYLDTLSDSYGCCGPRAVVSAGKDVWFLSEQRGVVSLQVHESGKLQGLDMPVSESIQPLIDRINWSFAKDSVGIYINNKIYFAVPIDNAQKNNALICFDFKNKNWTGLDQSDAFGKAGSCSVAGFTSKATCELGTANGGGNGTWTSETGILDLITFKYNGAERLFMVTTEGYIGVYDDPLICDQYDEITITATTTGRNVEYKDINTELITRGYTFGSSDFKKYTQSNIIINTNNIVSSDVNLGINISAQFDGVEESYNIVKNLKFKREKYHKPFTKADYVLSNTNDDHLVPNRQDYSMSLEDQFDPKTKGVDPDKKQESLQKKRFNKRGSYMQLKITNNIGVCEVKATEVHAIPDRINQITTRR